MRVNYRKENPDAVDYGDEGSTVVEKVGSALAGAAKLAVGAYAAKKIGGGLSDVGEGLKELKNPQGD